MGALLWILVVEAAYLRALHVLRGRGVRVPVWQVACFHLGIALWLAGLVSPIAGRDDELLSAHMVEHLLIADLAAPLLLAGMRNPVLAFLLPRPVLVTVARMPRLRGTFRFLRRPLVAIPVYVLVLYSWHFEPLFVAAVKYDSIHALQHASFVAAGMIVWWPALEPKRRRLRGELWKIGHILAARFAGMFLAMVFVLLRQPIYSEVYGTGERPLGFSALGDQQAAGAIMLSVDICLMVFALSFFFLRAAQDDERRNPRSGTTPREAV